MNKLNGLQFTTDLGHGKITYTITIERNRISIDTNSNIGRKCVFNKLYEEFTIEKLITDLHDQQLEEVENYIADYFGI